MKQKIFVMIFFFLNSHKDNKSLNLENNWRLSGVSQCILTNKSSRYKHNWYFVICFLKVKYACINQIKIYSVIRYFIFFLCMNKNKKYTLFTFFPNVASENAYINRLLLFVDLLFVFNFYIKAQPKNTFLSFLLANFRR